VKKRGSACPWAAGRKSSAECGPRFYSFCKRGPRTLTVRDCRSPTDQVGRRMLREQRDGPFFIPLLLTARDSCTQLGVSGLFWVKMGSCWSCPLYPRKRTCAVHDVMSALGQ
jgi:hypothetical protein